MRALLGTLIAVMLLLIVAAPPLAWSVRQMPGVALASALAAGASLAVAWWARRRRLPLELTTLLLLPPAAAWGLGEGLGLFARVACWDAIAHTVAGLAIGALATPFLLAHLRPDARRRRGMALLGAVGIAALAGALWEAGEWTSDTLLGSRTLGNAADTVADLVCDVAGALAGGGAAFVAGSRLPELHRRRLALPFRALARGQ